MDSKMISTSRWMSYVLRYGASELGLQTRPGGWIKLSELEASGRVCEMEMIVVLRHDVTGRYEAFCERGEFWIRAAPNREQSTPFPIFTRAALPPPPPLMPPSTVPPPPPTAPPPLLPPRPLVPLRMWPNSRPHQAPILSTVFSGGHATPTWNGQWCPRRPSRN